MPYFNYTIRDANGQTRSGKVEAPNAEELRKRLQAEGLQVLEVTEDRKAPRVPAVEVMIATPAIRNLIRENKTHQIHTMIQTSGQMGMQTMDQSLRDLYVKGWVTYEEAMSRAINPDELRKMIAPTGGVPGAPGAQPPRGR